jgi:polygalacturonase
MRTYGTWLFAIVLIGAGCASRRQTVFSVRDNGAVGDGKALDTAAFQKSLDACTKAGGGEVVVPAGSYLIGSVVLGSNTTLNLQKDATLIGSPDKADYPLINVRWEGEWRQGHRALIYAEKADNVAIVGQGRIVGDPQIGFLRDPRGPCIIEPVECRNVRIEGISIEYIRMWAVHLTYCRDVVCKGLTIRSDPRRSNGDGIDVDSCSKVRIENCDIDCGDDAIALKSGRGMEAVHIGRPTEDVLITGCRLGSTFAAVALGTEMSGGLRNIRVEKCTFTRRVNGIYIKSRTGRGGYIRDITFEDIDVTEGCQHFLHIDLVTKGIVATEPVTGDDAYPVVSNLRINNIRSNAGWLVRATSIAPQRPIEGLVITNVTGACRRAINLANINGVDLRDIDVTGYEGELVSSENITGPATRPVTSRSQQSRVDMGAVPIRDL